MVSESVNKDVDPVVAKIRELSDKISINQKLKNLLEGIKTLASTELSSAEENVVKISNDCKALVFNGESFGDMAKLGMRYSKEKGFNIKKTANLYGIVRDHLKSKGFKVEENITKISSEKVNTVASIYKPIEEYHMSIMKIAGLREMQNNLTQITQRLTKEILTK